MNFNFRKRKKILPGVYLNFSKRGISANIGPKGANVSVNKNGTYLNLGIPGSGLYKRKRLRRKNLVRKNTPKTKTGVIVLAFFLGTFGVHRFYLNQYLKGFLYLLFCWTLIPTIISFIDIFIFYAMPIDVFNNYYNQKES